MLPGAVQVTVADAFAAVISRGVAVVAGPAHGLPWAAPLDGVSTRLVRVLLGGNALAAIANANSRVVNPALKLVFSAALGKFQLTSFLDALQEVRLADLQAEPSIVTLDNRQADVVTSAWARRFIRDSMIFGPADTEPVAAIDLTGVGRQWLSNRETTEFEAVAA